MSHSDEEEEEDIVDVLRTTQSLNDKHVLYLINIFIVSMFGNEECIALIDSVFTTLYMKRSRPNSPKRVKESAASIERRRLSMATYFDRSDFNERDNRVVNNIRRHKSITIMPIHDSNHWSLLVYFNDHRQFYHFDSLSHYHQDYVIDVIHKLVDDKIITQIHENTITIMDCPAQLSDYECGQYVSMYLYAFLKTIQTENHTTRMRGRPHIYITDIEGFNQRLQEYVKSRCRECYRSTFIQILIGCIHEKRGY